MNSYAQMGETSQPPPPSLGMKRSRPPENRPPQMMMGSNNTYADDMGPRGGPPPSYRDGHNSRASGVGYRPPTSDNIQDRRSISHQPPLPSSDDQYGRRGDWGRSSETHHEDQFGRQLPPKRTSSGYGRGPPSGPVRGHPRFIPDANRADVVQRPERALSPPPRRESSYNRFDNGARSHDASMPSYASIADKPAHQNAEEHSTHHQQHHYQHQQPPHEETEPKKKDDAVADDEVKVVESKNRQRSKTPPPDPAPVVVVPPSPKSPPPAPPSAYALAMARMLEMNADMEFAWVRMQMLDTEVQDRKSVV